MALRPVPPAGVRVAPHYAAITVSDTVNFTDGICTSIWVGVAGNVQVVRWDDTVVQFAAVGGTVIPVMAKRVNSTSTTASGLVALYGA